MHVYISNTYALQWFQHNTPLNEDTKMCCGIIHSSVFSLRDSGHMLSVLTTKSSWVHSEELVPHKQLQSSKCLHWKQTFRIKKAIHTPSTHELMNNPLQSYFLEEVQSVSYRPSAKATQQSLEQRSDWNSSLYTAPNMSTWLPGSKSVELQHGGNIVHWRAWSSSSFRVTKTDSEDVAVACLFPLLCSTRMVMKHMRWVL